MKTSQTKKSVAKRAPKITKATKKPIGKVAKKTIKKVTKMIKKTPITFITGNKKKLEEFMSIMTGDLLLKYSIDNRSMDLDEL